MSEGTRYDPALEGCGVAEKTPWQQVLAVAEEMEGKKLIVPEGEGVVTWAARLRWAQREAEGAALSALGHPGFTARAGRCWFTHDWTRWEKFQEHYDALIYKPTGRLIPFKHVKDFQFRACLRCGLREERGL